MNNTVFIIGAGASKEVNLPVGFELKETISNLLSFDNYNYPSTGDKTIYDALFTHNSNKIKSLVKQSNDIAKSLPLAISIDNYLDAHRDNQDLILCGKLAIVRSILNAEKESLLYEISDFSKISNTWYISFFQRLTENCHKDDLKERFSQVSLIIFNYDRCVEHFLYNALLFYYKLNNAEVQDVMNCLKIIHPYGDVGGFPWLFNNGCLSFGSDINSSMLLHIANRIKTFTERIDETEVYNDMQKTMYYSKRIVFLGFAYHDLNMELLTPNARDHDKLVLGSTYGISVPDENYIKDKLENMFKIDKFKNIKLGRDTCNKFFYSYSRALSFSK